MKEFTVQDGVISRTPKIKPMSTEDKLNEILRNTRQIMEGGFGRRQVHQSAIWTSNTDEKTLSAEEFLKINRFIDNGVWDNDIVEENLEGTPELKVLTKEEIDDMLWTL